jgi:transcriptional regulator with XRE-family HTH domain
LLDDKEPRERLRAARINARLSVDLLAERLAVAASTVRAHESGQNKIKPDMAEKYANELHVSADWLLFGTGIGPRTVPIGVRSIPIVGELRRGSWLEPTDRRVERYITMETIGYDHVELEAYRIGNEVGPEYPNGTILFVAPVAKDRLSLRFSEEVVLRRERGGLYELSLRLALRKGLISHKLEYIGQPTADGRPREVVSEDDPTNPTLVGMVVGAFWMREVSPGELFARSAPSDIYEGRTFKLRRRRPKPVAGKEEDTTESAD